VKSSFCKAWIAGSWLLPGLLIAVESTNPKTSSAPSTTVSAAKREEMARAHEEMASCLRSKKPLEDCQAEMRATCQKSMGQGACPMMGAGMMYGDGKGKGPIRPH
jgi:hypothetical protein